MAILDELAKLSAAEEFFDYLNVPYDIAVLRVARLHILRRMGQYLAAGQEDGLFADLDDDAIRNLCQGYLLRAYEDFVASSPIDERLFKVLKDAVAPKPQPAKAFFPLATLTLPGSTQQS